MREFKLRFRPDCVSRQGRSIDKRSTYRRNSGVALYLSNSLSHSARESGGSTPVMGRHSVMLSPDSVSRVTPPTTITAMTSTDESMSQFPTAGGENTGSPAEGSAVVPLDEEKRSSSADVEGKPLNQGKPSNQ